MRREGTIGPITNVQVVEGPSSFCTATFIADEIEALLILRFAKKNDSVDSSILIVVVDRFTRVHIGLKVFFEFGGITFDPDVLAKRRCSVFTIDIIADKMGIGGAPLGTRKFYRLPESGIFNRCSAVASILEWPGGNGITCCAKAAGPIGQRLLNAILYFLCRLLQFLCSQLGNNSLFLCRMPIRQ